MATGTAQQTPGRQRFPAGVLPGFRPKKHRPQKGSSLYRSGLLGFSRWGARQFPGVASGLQLNEHSDAYGRPFALIHAAATETYTVVIESTPDDADRASTPRVAAWVDAWDTWLTALVTSTKLAAASVVVHTTSSFGRRGRHVDPGRDDSDNASTCAAYVALTFAGTAKPNKRKQDDPTMGHAVGAALPGLTSGLVSAVGGSTRLLTAHDVCALTHTAYTAHTQQAGLDVEWADVGPDEAHERWDAYLHDQSCSATWCLTTGTHGALTVDLKQQLLAPHPQVDARRVAFLYRPYVPRRAAGIAESDLRITPAPAPERDHLATGHDAKGAAPVSAPTHLVGVGALVTTTIHHTNPNRPAGPPVQSAAATLRLRPAYASQAAAFAASLPLGIQLPQHAAAPAPTKTMT